MHIAIHIRTCSHENVSRTLCAVILQFSRNLTGMQEDPSSTSSGSGSRNGPALGGRKTNNVEAHGPDLTSSTGGMNENSLFANEDSEDDDILKIDKKKRKRDRIVMEPSDFPTPPKSSTPSTPASALPMCHGDGRDDQPTPQPEQLVTTIPGNISGTMSSSSLSVFSSSPVLPGPSLTHRTEVLFSLLVCLHTRGRSTPTVPLQSLRFSFFCGSFLESCVFSY